MGCFSYICVKCGNPIFADKYGNCIGERVRLARIVDGKVVEWMKGKYNSYGRVHANRNSKHFIIKEGKEVEVESKNIEDEHEWASAEWNEMVDEQFNSNKCDGIVAIHEKCWKGDFGSCQSMDDKDQGWRDYTKDYTKCYKCNKENKTVTFNTEHNDFICEECKMTPLQKIVKNKMEKTKCQTV